MYIMSNEQINKVCAVLNKETPDPDLIYKSVVAEPVIRNFENRLDVINNKRKKGLWADIVSHIFGGFIHLRISEA